MEPEQRSVLLIAAHPDDEIIGAGIWMARHRNRDRITIVHVTDGAPRNHPDMTEYARARRRELYRAVGLVGIRPDQCREFGFVDQEACLHMPELVERIAELLEEVRPERVLTHPYEGGHPDHDAIAFAVAQASDGHHEFTSYHASAGTSQALETGRFLSNSLNEEILVLTPAERDLKQRMYASFPTQQEILQLFPIEHERFRPAPAYDFTQPPHPGELQYERWGFAVGSEWRRRAIEALEELRIPKAIL